MDPSAISDHEEQSASGWSLGNLLGRVRTLMKQESGAVPDEGGETAAALQADSTATEMKPEEEHASESGAGQQNGDPTPEAGGEALPLELWAYLERFHTKDITSLPSHADRERLLHDDRRRMVWDYFFPIEPPGGVKVGQVHFDEIARLLREKDELLRTHGIATVRRRRAMLTAREEAQARAQSRVARGFRPDDPYTAAWRVLSHHYDRLDAMLQDKPVSVDDLRMEAVAEAALDEKLDELQRMLEEEAGRLKRQRELLAAIGEDFTVELRGPEPNHDAPVYVADSALFLEVAADGITERLDAVRADIRAINAARQRIRSLELEIESLQRRYMADCQRIDDRIARLRAYIESIRAQVPEPPSGDLVGRWLLEDLDRLQQESIRQTGSAPFLPPISYYDPDGNEIVVDNPIRFVSPAELQAPEAIPSHYRPPQLHRWQQATSTIRSQILDPLSGSTPSGTIDAQDFSDRVKHLSAKQRCWSAKGGRLDFGVYYLEFLLILEDMMTSHSLFYDFITGKVIGSRTTEIYYEDIVAIEQTREYRAILLNEEQQQAFVVEDVPGVSVLLPNGQLQTISFANHSYLLGVLDHLAESSDTGDTHAALNALVEEQVGTAKRKADAAIAVMRKHLRDHKGRRH